MILPAELHNYVGELQEPPEGVLDCSLLDFLISPRRRAWLEYENMKVYVRKSGRLDPESQEIVPAFDVASIEVYKAHRGKGVFTAWLSEVELAVDEIMLPVFVENVLSKRFEKFFDDRGYTRVPWCEIVPSFWRPARKANES